MPYRSENYFRHFPVAPEYEPWGVAVTAVGSRSVAPNVPYPPVIYPEDHLIDWSHGRVIDCFQITLITAGRGMFESDPTGPRRLSAGSAVLLLPGVRHVYGPSAETGWEEYWVEFRGKTVESLLGAGILNAETAVRSTCPALDSAFDALHARVQDSLPGFDAELAARMLAVLAGWVDAGRKETSSRVTAAVGEAARYLSAHLAEPVNMEDLAGELGVTYSNFRRAFKLHTGYSPWQYVLQLRLMRARRLLSESGATLEEVAAGLGFNSAFHLSVAFKHAYGVAPSQWRKPSSANER